jgi:hypothetical protein
VHAGETLQITDSPEFLDTENLSSTACQFERALREKVVGQDQAVEALVEPDLSKATSRRNPRFQPPLEDRVRREILTACQRANWKLGVTRRSAQACYIRTPCKSSELSRDLDLFVKSLAMTRLQEQFLILNLPSPFC